MSDIVVEDCEQLCGEFASFSQGGVCYLLTESKVWSLWGDRLRQVWPEDLELKLWVGAEGEDIKSFSMYQLGIEALLRSGLKRGHRLVALGGGAVSDAVGMMSMTVLRGVDWAIVPTTLLSMVDASLGGKVGLNLSLGKNLVGGFYPPKCRFVFSGFLDTLSGEQWQSGLGEVIKYAFLDEAVSKAIFTKCSLETIVEKCVFYKEQLVLRDPYDKGDRIFLNLGHTFGHAFEKELVLPHGLAVVLGLEALFQFFGYTKQLAELDQLKGHLGLSLSLHDFLPKLNKEQFFNYILMDKKRKNGQSVCFVVCEKKGFPFLKEASVESVKTFVDHLA